MKRLKIILDCDDVLSRTNEEVIRIVNAGFDTSFTEEDITDWEYRKIRSVLPGIDMHRYFMRPGFFRDLELVEGAKEGVSKLLQVGHDVLVATAVPEYGYGDRIAWIQENFPQLAGSLVLTGRKDVLMGDIMLDDGIHNIRSSICRYPVIFEKPWNRYEPDFGNYLHVASWTEFLELVYLIEQGYSYNDLLERQKGEGKYEQAERAFVSGIYGASCCPVGNI